MIEPAQIALRDPATKLRLAGPADEPFARRLYKASRAEDFAAASLAPSALDTLLDQQYRAQVHGYATQFPGALTLIIIHQGEPSGRLVLCTLAARWHIVDILLLPAMRGRGIGTDVLDALATAARESGAEELTLSVLSTNFAGRRLYERLGFEERQTGVRIEMGRTLKA